MRYTPATIAKALVAFVTAFGGAAATSAPHDPTSWAGCIGAGLVAFAAVFATPNKSADAAMTPADQVINGVNQVIANAQSAHADIQKVKDAVSQVVQDVPILGPLAKQAIDSLPNL